MTYVPTYVSRRYQPGPLTRRGSAPGDRERLRAAQLEGRHLGVSEPISSNPDTSCYSSEGRRGPGPAAFSACFFFLCLYYCPGPRVFSPRALP